MRERRQTDDMTERYYGLGQRPLGTVPGGIDAAQLRTEPASDLDALLHRAQASPGGARMVVGGGHAFRPAESGEIFVNIDSQSRPDVVADFRDLSMFPDEAFDQVYVEAVPLGTALKEGGAAELNRVLQPGGPLAMRTGLGNLVPATERDANVRALQDAGFDNIEYTVARDDMFDTEEGRLSDWNEVSAIKSETNGFDGAARDGNKSVEDTFDESGGLSRDDIP